jgi:hypothetical protein
MGGDLGGVLVVHRAERARGSSGGGREVAEGLMLTMGGNGGFGGEGQEVEPVFIED